MTSLFIILFTFIHNSSSKKDRKITASKLLTHRFSAGCIGEFLQFLLQLAFPGQISIRRQLTSFYLCCLKKIQSIFLISSLRLLQKLFLRVCLLVFIVAALVFSQRIYSNIKSKQTDDIQNKNKKRFAVYLKTENG